MDNFWQSLQKPIIALAPMEDVTDTVFREVIRSVSDPEALHVMFTEFTSTDELCNKKGRESVATRLVVNETERELLETTNTKLVVQIWCSDSEKFYESAKLITDMELFDAIDINMDCPVKKVVKNHSCSDLINHPEMAKEIIIATREGTDLPVSVKTRIGFNSIVTERWIGQLLEVQPAAIIIHSRTRAMMSTGLALWDEIAKAAQLRNQMNSSTLILGNGDVDSHATALARVHDFGVDGVMVGTSIFKNPWMFNIVEKKLSRQMRIDLLVKHIALFDQTWMEHGSFNVLKRFFKIYLNGFEGAAHWRDQLMHCKTCREALEVIKRM